MLPVESQLPFHLGRVGLAGQLVAELLNFLFGKAGSSFLNALSFLKCFVLENCPRSYWLSIESVITIIALKTLQPTKVSQEYVTMTSTPNVGKLSTPAWLSTPASLPEAQSLECHWNLLIPIVTAMSHQVWIISTSSLARLPTVTGLFHFLLQGLIWLVLGRTPLF